MVLQDILWNHGTVTMDLDTIGYGNSPFSSAMIIGIPLLDHDACQYIASITPSDISNHQPTDPTGALNIANFYSPA